MTLENTSSRAVSKMKPSLCGVLSTPRQAGRTFPNIWSKKDFPKTTSLMPDLRRAPKRKKGKYTTGSAAVSCSQFSIRPGASLHFPDGFLKIFRGRLKLPDSPEVRPTPRKTRRLGESRQNT